MFDQYKQVVVHNETVQVGLLFRKLEDKARKEFDLQTETMRLKLLEVQAKADQYCAVLAAKDENINVLKTEICDRERERDALLKAEEGHVERIELLVTKTNTLKNQLQELKTH